VREKVVVLTGGIGGAKLVLGLTQVVPPEQIIAVVNTGDDFRHLGLWISPDLDTLLYTLAGKASSEHGWGRESETWTFMEALRTLDAEDWFLLGDGDLALHVVRTARLASGTALSQITQDVARAWHIRVKILPMSDDRVSTFLMTNEGDLPFQSYFVKRNCEPIVSAVHFEGATNAKATPGVAEAICDAGTRAVLIAPSNPYLSIDPILAVADIRCALMATSAPVIAISPIVGAKAVKGPTAKLMTEMGVAITPGAIADHYGSVLDGILVDERDGLGSVRIASALADMLMISLADRARVASAALALSDHLAS
jgi:LPPG:FO 2-phospho-L-lactate transferase